MHLERFLVELNKPPLAKFFPSHGNYYRFRVSPEVTIAMGARVKHPGETWNGDTVDPAMNSYNHYAFGSVIAWVYRYAAGIDTTLTAPGFKEIVIHPHLDSRMPSARAEYESVYGRIVSDWKGTPGGPFSLRVTIPANTTATVFLPAIAGAQVTEGGKPVETRSEDGASVVHVGSGTYRFEVMEAALEHRVQR